MWVSFGIYGGGGGGAGLYRTGVAGSVSCSVGTEVGAKFGLRCSKCSSNISGSIFMKCWNVRGSSFLGS